MPAICVLMLFAPLFVAIPMAIDESHKEQQVNQICTQKFNNTKDIKDCKNILMKVNIK